MKPRPTDFACLHCEKRFHREVSRDQHMTAMHPGGGVVYRPHAPANTNLGNHTANSRTNTPALREYTRTDPREYFVIDFVSLATRGKCAKCGESPVIPLTRLCPSCDPLLDFMAEDASDKAHKDAERKARTTERSFVGRIVDAASSAFAPPKGNYDLYGEHADDFHGH